MGFQKKVIESYITKRIDFWTWSLKKPVSVAAAIGYQYKDEKDLESEEFKKLIVKFQDTVRDHTIVTGGCIASMLLGETVNDVDIYFSNKEVARQVARYYVEDMKQRGNLKDTWAIRKIDVIDNDTNGVAVFIKSMGVVEDDTDSDDYGYFESMSDNDIDQFFNDYKKEQKGEPLKTDVRMITSNAITLNNEIQIILRFCGTPEEIHNNYDFVHATNLWTKSTGLVYNQDALQALLERRLKYVGSRFPVASIFRVRKFIRRGFHISAGELTKIAYDISKLNLDDRKVLHDQLIGVDYAYFSEVLSVIRKESSREIDRTYLFELINRIFEDDDPTEPTVGDE